MVDNINNTCKILAHICLYIVRSGQKLRDTVIQVSSDNLVDPALLIVSVKFIHALSKQTVSGADKYTVCVALLDLFGNIKHTLGMERYIRLRSLGKNYSEEEIRGQILQPKVKRVYQKAVQIHPKKKLTGIQALYYSYLYQMGVLPKRPKRSPYAVREDIRKLDQRIEQIEFLMKHDITTREQLATYREPLQKQISELMKERRKLYRNDSEDSGKARLSEINEELKNLGKEVRMTVRIEKHSLEIEERLRKAEEQNQNEKRVEHKEKESQEVR